MVLSAVHLRTVAVGVRGGNSCRVWLWLPLPGRIPLGLPCLSWDH